MVADEEAGGIKEVDVRCPGCECPLSRVLGEQHLSRRKGGEIVSKKRECENCGRVFYSREVVN